jgi:hypothetical protein
MAYTMDDWRGSVHPDTDAGRGVAESTFPRPCTPQSRRALDPNKAFREDEAENELALRFQMLIRANFGATSPGQSPVRQPLPFGITYLLFRLTPPSGNEDIDRIRLVLA